MKKAFSVFLSFCLCTITMLGFTACGDDEHEGKRRSKRNFLIHRKTPTPEK